MIKCVNWILTRKCNLKCNYCGITRDYKYSPYPDLNYFFKNEMSTDFIIKGLDWFKNHNPNIFNLLYGGEPLLRDDLPDIINYCNNNNISYTIISNGFERKRIKYLFANVDYINGFTCSIDPIIMKKHNTRCDIFDKSAAGLSTLCEYKSVIKDPVAEITIDNNNINYLIPLVENLTSKNICSDITFIDVAKNKYYDFSNVTDKNLLVQKTDELINCFNQIIDNGLNVHLPEILPEILNILPSNLDCNSSDRIKNLVIDSDGSVRLCLRIRGIETPKKKFYEYFKNNNSLDKLLKNIKIDKRNTCSKCNWTCQLMLNKQLIH